MKVDSGEVLGTIFRDALEFLTDTVEADRAIILYSDGSPSVQGCRVWGARGIDPDTVFTGGPVSIGLLESVFQEATPRVVRDAQVEPDLRDRWSVVVSSIHSILCVPFWGPSGKVSGLMYADSLVQKAAFDNRTLERAVRYARALEARLNSLHAGDRERALVRPQVPARPAVRPPPVRFAPQPVRADPEPVATGPGPTSERPVSDRPSRGSVSRPALVSFFRSLATMTGAGVSLARALDLLAEQGEDPGMRTVCRELGGMVRSGYSLSRAMSAFPQAFARFHLQMARVGEETGGLHQVLLTVADYEEKLRANQMKLRSVLTYPLLVLAVSTLMLLCAPSFLLEGQLQLIRDSGVEPPAITRALMIFSDLVSSPLFLGLVGLCLLVTVAGFRAAYRKSKVRRWTWTALMRTPQLGRVLRNLAVARFAVSLGMQLECGVLLTEALKLAGGTSMNPLLEARMDSAVSALKEGASLAGSLEVTRFFPRAFLSMVEAGEQSGKTAAMMTWVGHLTELELEASFDTYKAMLEPAVMLVMGVLVGFMLIATMLPMVQALQTL